jgi:TRAP-type mannitol/chloroaromatic compound transport system substrate-binding protein
MKFIYVILFLLCSYGLTESAVRIDVQTTTPTGTPATPGGDGALLFAQRVADITGNQIRLTIHEPGTLVNADGILDAVSKGSDSGGIDAAIVVPTQNKIKVGDSFIELPFTALYISGTPFGPEAEEFLSWMYEGGGLELENSLYNKLLKSGDGVVVMPVGLYHGDGSGMTPTRIPKTTAEFANTPWNLRILGLGGKVIDRAISKIPGNHSLVIHPGTVNIPVYDDLRSGALQASEFGSPARDLFEFFDKPVLDGNPPVSQISPPLRFYYLGAWHQPFIMFELVINRSVFENLGSKAQKQLENAARAQIQSEFARTDQASGQAVLRLEKTYGVTVVKSWPAAILADLREATDEVLQKESRDAEFRSVLKSLQKFTRRQQFYWKYNNVDPTKRFE